MAKKTESTAVNDLINLVATQGASVKDPGADLFSEPPRKSARMTSTVPGAGAVAPLPRSARGTQENVAIPAAPPVRMSTAMPSRANSIPPIPALPQAKRPSLPPPRSSATMARPPIPSSPRIAPPPVAAAVDIDIDVEADLLATPVHQQPRKIAAPAPVIAPVTLQEPVYPLATPDMTSSSAWFEESRTIDRVDPIDPNTASHSMAESTAQVPRSSTLVLLKKLALPMGIAIVLGVFVGGYIVFDGQGGKKRASNAIAAKTDGTVAANVAPAAVEPAKAEPAVAPPESAAEPIKDLAAEPAVVEPAKTEPAAEPVAVEPAKAEPAVVEPAKTEPAVAAKTEPAKVATTDHASVLAGAVESLPTTATRPVAAKVALVDVRIDSTPAGATVMLVDRGKTNFLGTTPISASVDPSRTYELVFTYANKPTQVERLDPKTMTRMSVTLGKSDKKVTEVKVAKAEPKAKTEVKAKTELEVAKAEPKVAKAEPKVAKTEAKVAKKSEPAKAVKASVADPFETKPEAKPEAKAEAKAGGNGVLMISSKPPCEIWVDGSATGLMTPQRALPLPAGKHKITLVSADKAHKKTVAVEITADKPTKVIQDLLK